MRNNEPVGRTAADTTRGRNTRWTHGQRASRTTRGRNPAGRTARGQASGLCATKPRGAARASAWPTSGARLDAPSRSQSASIDPRWAGGPFVAPSPCSPRRRSWPSTMRHRLGQANALAATRRCVAQRPEACPLAVRPAGFLPRVVRLVLWPCAQRVFCRASCDLPSGRASNGCSCRASCRPPSVQRARCCASRALALCVARGAP